MAVRFNRAGLTPSVFEPHWVALLGKPPLGLVVCLFFMGPLSENFAFILGPMKKPSNFNWLFLVAGAGLPRMLGGPLR